MYNQNQVDIERYAQDILANNFPTGIFMIDDNWQNIMEILILSRKSFQIRLV